MGVAVPGGASMRALEEPAPANATPAAVPTVSRMAAARLRIMCSPLSLATSECQRESPRRAHDGGLMACDEPVTIRTRSPLCDAAVLPPDHAPVAPSRQRGEHRN